jgi:hypothetical protein
MAGVLDMPEADRVELERVTRSTVGLRGAS